MNSNAAVGVNQENDTNEKIAFEANDDDCEDTSGTKGHTFRKRRLTYTEKHLADALKSPDLQALADLDSSGDDNDDDNAIKNEDKLPQDSTSSSPSMKNSDSTEIATNSLSAVGAIANDSNTNCITNSSTNDDSVHDSNQLEAKVLHASAPPIPKDCMKRRGSLLYAHHEEHPENQRSIKKVKLLDDDSKNDDETSSTSSSDEVEWKKRRIHAKDDDSLPFPRHIVGTYSCHGIEPVYEEPDQGNGNGDAAPFIAKINQDRGGVAFPYANNSKMAVFAAYDGHGDGGEHVAQYALHEIPRRLELHEDFVKGNFEKAFKEVFVGVDKDLAYEDEIEPEYSGCTACVALLKERSIYLANAGDSRAVMAYRSVKNGKTVRQALDLTIDQNPDSPGEQERIEEMGGFVSPPPEEGLSARVWLDCNYRQIGLAMSRSLGDHAVKSVGVIATPVVSKHELTENDDFMIIATDGVWEFMSSQEAVDIVSMHLDSGKGSSVACQNLIESAAGLWHENEGDYRDDITALVVKVNELWKN